MGADWRRNYYVFMCIYCPPRGNASDGQATKVRKLKRLSAKFIHRAFRQTVRVANTDYTVPTSSKNALDVLPLYYLRVVATAELILLLRGRA